MFSFSYVTSNYFPCSSFWPPLHILLVCQPASSSTNLILECQTMCGLLTLTVTRSVSKNSRYLVYHSSLTSLEIKCMMIYWLNFLILIQSTVRQSIFLYFQYTCRGHLQSYFVLSIMEWTYLSVPFLDICITCRSLFNMQVLPLGVSVSVLLRA